MPLQIPHTISEFSNSASFVFGNVDITLFKPREISVLSLTRQASWAKVLIPQGYKDTRIQGYKDTRIQGYKDTRIQGYKDTRIQGYKDTRIQGYKDTRIQGYKDTRIQE